LKNWEDKREKLREKWTSWQRIEKGSADGPRTPTRGGNRGRKIRRITPWKTELFGKNFVRNIEMNPVTSDTRCTRKTESRIAMAKTAFNNKRHFSPTDWT
jgi:hypothetical protein